MTEILGEINGILLWAWIALPSTTFVMLYGIFFDWWISRHGRATYIATASLMALADLVILFHFLLPSPLMEAVIKMIVFLGIGTGSTYKLYLVIRSKIEDVRSRRDLGLPRPRYTRRILLAGGAPLAFILIIGVLSWLSN